MACTSSGKRRNTVPTVPDVVPPPIDRPTRSVMNAPSAQPPASAAAVNGPRAPRQRHTITAATNPMTAVITANRPSEEMNPSV